MVREDNLRRAVPRPRLASLADVPPLQTVVVMKQVGSRPAAYWYGSAGRALFAEELNGRWKQIEYIFPVDTRLFHLRWAEGRPTRLWSAELVRDKARVKDSLLVNARMLEITFPADEIQRLKTLMQEVPHSLWARVLKLAMDAHFAGHPFPQRRVERPLKAPGTSSK